MRALVTGATGFVGEPLCRQLLKDGAFVRGSTRDRNRTCAASDTVVIGAIDGQTDWAAALDGIDVVFHLAGIAHIVEPSQQQHTAYECVNADGTERLAREAARAGVGRFVFLSSLKVNGEHSPAGGFRESDAARPEGPYAASKLHAEERLGDVARDTGLRCAILRSPLVYGPRVRANFLELIRAIDRGRPLPFALVRNERSLIFVDNLCSALRCLASHPSAAGETFFASDGEPVSTAELIRRAAAALDRRPRLVPVPVALLRAAAAVAGKGDAVQRLTASLVVDDRKIRTLLGWAPPHDMDRGLAETIAWYRGMQHQ